MPALYKRYTDVDEKSSLHLQIVPPHSPKRRCQWVRYRNLNSNSQLNTNNSQLDKNNSQLDKNNSQLRQLRISIKKKQLRIKKVKKMLHSQKKIEGSGFWVEEAICGLPKPRPGSDLGRERSVGSLNPAQETILCDIT